MRTTWRCALVSETPAASYESNDARKHVDAMRRHRDHVITEIAELEARQDRLLDELSQRARWGRTDRLEWEFRWRASPL